MARTRGARRGVDRDGHEHWHRHERRERRQCYGNVAEVSDGRTKGQKAAGEPRRAHDLGPVLGALVLSLPPPQTRVLTLATLPQPVTNHIYVALDTLASRKNGAGVNLIAMAIVSKPLAKMTSGSQGASASRKRFESRILTLWTCADWACMLHLYDPTNASTGFVVEVRYYGKLEQDIPVVQDGDIIVIQGLNVRATSLALAAQAATLTHRSRSGARTGSNSPLTPAKASSTSSLPHSSLTAPNSAPSRPRPPVPHR